MLMDGGSDSQACFWKLVRHLDRIDAVMLTHAGTGNLPGVNAFLERKVAELELSSDIKGGKAETQFTIFHMNIRDYTDVIIANNESKNGQDFV